MACIRKRRGKYVVDYRDGAGLRRWVTCETRRQAEDVLADRVRESRQPTQPVVASTILVSAYAERWEALIAVTIKPRTLSSYKRTLALHVMPALGHAQVRQLHKGRVKALLAEKLASGLSKNSV